MCDIVVKKFTFTISSPDEFLFNLPFSFSVSQWVTWFFKSGSRSLLIGDAGAGFVAGRIPFQLCQGTELKRTRNTNTNYGTRPTKPHHFLIHQLTVEGRSSRPFTPLSAGHLHASDKWSELLQLLYHDDGIINICIAIVVLAAYSRQHNVSVCLSCLCNVNRACRFFF